MNTYTIYNANGEILSLFIGSASDLASNLKQGESYIEGAYTSQEYKIVDGIAVAKTDDEKLIPLSEAWAELRNTRNIELTLSDWTQMPDIPLSDAKKQEWATYRQQLRDMTSTSDPRNPVWPTKPS